MAAKYYVYFHYTSDYRLFYIGKGSGDRAFTNRNRNQWWHRTVEKYGLIVEIVQDLLMETEALMLEIDMIALNRKMEATLCNLTDGGENPPNATGKTPWNKGISPSQETRDRISFINRNNPVLHKPKTKEHSDKVSKARRLKYGTSIKESLPTRKYSVKTSFPAFINEYTNEIIPSGNNMREMCRKYQLDNSALCKVINGKLKSIRGWRVL